MRHRTSVWGVLLGIAFFATGSARADRPLFDEAGKTLEVTIETDFSKVNSPKQTQDEVGRTDLGRGMIDPIHFRSAGKLTYVDASGATVEHAIQVEPRGMRRRQSCKYKPLELRLDKKDKTGLFRNLAKSLDMVNDCQDGWEDTILAEYYAYRTFVAFGTPSLRPRLARVTYKDTSGKFPERTALSFFLENKKDAPASFGARLVDLDPGEELDPTTRAEESPASWVTMYGESYLHKMALRVRQYNKYVRLRAYAPRLPLRTWVKQYLGQRHFSTYNSSESSALLNCFPVRFDDGSMAIVNYDMDSGSMMGGFDLGRELPEILNGYLGNRFSKSWASLRGQLTLGEIHALQSELVLAFSESLAILKASGLEAELAADSSAPAKNYAKIVAKTKASLESFVADPWAAFAPLLKP